MRRSIAVAVFVGMAILSSCAKKESAEAPQPAAEAQPAAAQTGGAPHVSVILKDGSKVPGAIVASTQEHMVVAGDDGIERKIPLAQVKSVDYSQAAPAAQQARQAAPPARPAARKEAGRETAAQQAPPAQQAPAAPSQPAVTTKTYELPAGSEISVRTNETIDSSTAAEGQTFDAQVTRDAKDANGDVVIPRNASARIVIRSATKGGRIRGASDLVLDLQSVTIQGKQYNIDTVDITKKGKEGVGANKRTAGYTGGGAALGAIIGAVAGGGRGAAIGAGAGAGAGALTQILTKGGSIKVPVESVLTFSLDKPLRVTAAQ
ncbi:MAG: hypothetical protein ACE15B_24590 [Bryobacteraceae bacterium]